MTLPVCAVQCYVYTQDGDPVEGATISTKLTHYEIYQGHVVPDEMTALTDVDGLAVLELWPNELGSTGSSYKVKIDPPGKKSLTVYAVVPLALEANLSEIATLPVYEGKPDGQIGVELANAALVAANNAVISASSSASTAASQAGIATAQAGAAAGSASSASTSAGTSTEQAVIATAQAVIATDKAAEAAANVFANVTQIEAEEGTVTSNREWSPERVKQAITYQRPSDATQVEAEAGIVTTLRSWSPLRIYQAIKSLVVVTTNANGTAISLMGKVLIQVGVLSVTSGAANTPGSAVGTFPVTFAGKTVVYMTGTINTEDSVYVNARAQFTTSTTYTAAITSSVAALTRTVKWLAIGV